MKKIIFTTLFASTLLSSAAMAFDIKPGLWEVSGKFKTANGEIDPQAKMKEMLAKMPADQRKKMAEMLGKSGMELGSNGGFRICLTKNMIEKAEGFSGEKDGKCTTKVTKKTSSELNLEFSCEDGTKGKGVWTRQSDSAYTAKIDMQSKRGNESVTKQGKFVSSNCGNVKPAK